jgi:hypothetical protein
LRNTRKAARRGQVVRVFLRSGTQRLKRIFRRQATRKLPARCRPVCGPGEMQFFRVRQSTKYAPGSGQHRAHSRSHGFARDGGVQSESRPGQCACGSRSRLCLAAAVRFRQRHGYRFFRRSVRTGKHRSHHLEFFKRRAEWFEKATRQSYALWWIPEGHIPTIAEAKDRLEHYRKHSATPYSFWFSQPFPEPVLLSSQGAALTGRS